MIERRAHGQMHAMHADDSEAGRSVRWSKAAAPALVSAGGVLVVTVCLSVRGDCARPYAAVASRGCCDTGSSLFRQHVAGCGEEGQLLRVVDC